MGVNLGYSLGSHQNYMGCWDCMLGLLENKMEMSENMKGTWGCSLGMWDYMDLMETILDCLENMLTKDYTLLTVDCNLGK